MNLFDIPKWSQVHNPYHYVDRSLNQLLITVGDSWTYGDSLGNTCVREGRDNPEYRLQKVFGNCLSEQLDYSWMNLALPGVSNYCIITWLKELLDRIHHGTTVCVITLTESGRHEEIHWLHGQESLQYELSTMVDKTYESITALQKQFPRVKFVVAHNFTDSRTTNLNICERSWLEVLTNKTIQNDTHIVVSEHIAQLNYDYSYPDRIDVLDRALQRVDILDSCDYCYKVDSRHPNEIGHQLWADYLLTKI
jgi:hypothetical protein